MLAAFKTKLANASREFHFRFAIAALMVAFHIFAFYRAADDRLHVGFNTAAGEAPFYADANAPELSGRFPREPHHWSRLAVSRWDAQHHIGFALRGLSACPTHPDTATDKQYADCGLAWFPAWGLTAGAIANVTGAPVDSLLVLMSCLAALIIGLLWTSAPIVDRIGRGPAYASLLAFNLFPTAFFQVTPYPEAALIALALGCFVCVLRERWLLAAALVGAATALAPSAIGIAFGLAAAAFSCALRDHEAKKARWWRPLLAIPICVWGVALTFLAYQIELGNAFVYFRAQGVFATTGDSTMAKLLEPTFYLKGMLAENLTVVALIGGLAVVLVVARELKRAFKVDELVFLAASCAMVVARELSSIAAHGGGYWQLGRYLLSCPILFLAAGLFARKHRGAYVWWLLLCLGLYWHVELCSYLSHGDPRVCPCLGRFETYVPWQS
jgi:hypothetical protein